MTQAKTRPIDHPYQHGRALRLAPPMTIWGQPGTGLANDHVLDEVEAIAALAPGNHPAAV